MNEIPQDDLRKLLGSGPRSAHLVGVAGSGMSGLARLLVQRGHRVTGSDLGDEFDAEALRRMGVIRFRGHAPEHVRDPDFVCYSSAIPTDNPELLEAQRRGIPLVRRARALAALVPPQEALVVSGTHGKTTTTSMVAHILRSAGREPSFYIGAPVPDLGTNAAIGKGKHFVIEADESDGTMSEFAPGDLVILNVEAEHLDFYENLAAIERAFEALARSATGRVIYCADDPGAARVGKLISGAAAWSTMGVPAEWRSDRARADADGTRFEVWRGGRLLGGVMLKIPGRHNVSNALAALAVTLDTGVTFEAAAAALATFTGAKRRFDRLFESDSFLLVDDYAHHPSEVRATLEAARQRARGRLVVVFQPHRYSRTRALHADFGVALHGADHVFLTEVYAASETPIEGVDGRLIQQSLLAQPGRLAESVVYEPDLRQLKDRVGREIREGDLVLVMGAGNIHQISRRLAAELRACEELRARVSPATRLVRCEPMSKHTSMRVGGVAALWVEPADEENLARVLQHCHRRRAELTDDPLLERAFRVTLVGRGTNLLVRDAGISGVVVHLGADFFARIEARDGKIVAGAGARLKQVALAARRACLTGLEFVEGIPGSLGGALRMNAGAMGSNLFDVVECVRMMDPEGRIMEKRPAELGVEYRRCRGMEGFVALSAELRGAPGQAGEIAARLKEFESKRWSSQPAAPSAGCTFKNPPGLSAGKIMDELGLKGLSFGKARVSDAHANFIINEGGATAGDVLNLISLIRDRVRRERGIELETEVVVVGDEEW